MNDPEELERELRCVGFLAELAGFHRLASESFDGALHLAVPFDHGRAHRAVRRIVEFEGRGGQDVAARFGARMDPVHPACKEPADARHAARFLDGRAQDPVDEHCFGQVQGLDLQVFFRLEMGEEAALGDAGLFGQGAEREPGEPHAAGERQGFAQHASLGSLRFGDRGHGGRDATTDRAFLQPADLRQLFCRIASTAWLRSVFSRLSSSVLKLSVSGRSASA